MSEYITEKKISFSEALDIVGEYLKLNDLIVVPREKSKADRLRARYLKESALTYKQISDAKIWGDIGKQAVYDKVIKYLETGELQPHEVDRRNRTHKIRRQAFERIGKNLGTI